MIHDTCIVIFNGAVEIQPTLFSGVSKMSSYFRRQYINLFFFSLKGR